jgi:transposase InsO family protein
MSDNGACYRSRRFRTACRDLGLKLIYTKPYTPRTNGRPSASSRPHCANEPVPGRTTPSVKRAAEPPYWIHRYNSHRPHGSIGAAPPISILGLTGNNLLRLHS